MITAEAVSVDFNSRKSVTRLRAVENINFVILPGEFIALVGPSGCGKSTLVNAIAGFIRPTSGKMLYRAGEISGASRERVMIFQNHSLFPWLSAAGNIAFALQARGVNKREVKERSLEFLKLVKLEKFADHFPAELSGGQQQRIGIARALAAKPEVLLLDEPFASLDQFTRDLIQEEMLKIIRPLNMTAVLVTHNISEAIFFADRIFVMNGHPGTVIETIDIKIEKPVSIQDVDNNDEFRKIKKKINQLLKTNGERNEN